MTWTGYENPVDGETYPFYDLQFNLLSPETGVQLIIKVVTPDLGNSGTGSAAQAAVESVLASIATAVAGFENVQSETTDVQRYDATATVLESD